MAKVKSPRFSFKGWDLWVFLRDRKRTIITAIGVLCSYLALDTDLTTMLAGGVIFEAVWSILEYYFKKR